MPERICIVPRVSGVGGMVSFLHKFSVGVQARGVQVTNELSDTPYGAILVIGGTRELGALYAAHRRGIRIVQRLDGLNWIHRVRPVSLKHSLRAEYGNLLLSMIRRFLADRIVVLSPRPGRIAEIVVNRLGRPRAMRDTGTPEFAAIAERLRRLFDSQGRLD